VANVNAEGTLWLKSTARFFGDVTAANLVVEPGALFVGAARIGLAVSEAPSNSAPKPSPTAQPSQRPNVGRLKTQKPE
jgi:cytoskeletal protein CcmA (bactofilin family)